MRLALPYTKKGGGNDNPEHRCTSLRNSVCPDGAGQKNRQDFWHNPHGPGLSRCYQVVVAAVWARVTKPDCFNFARVSPAQPLLAT